MELEVANNGSTRARVNDSWIPLPERTPPPFIGVSDLFPQISWREGLPHGDEGGGMVHNKGSILGLGPWQERRHQS